MLKVFAKETFIYGLADFTARFVNFMLFPFIALALSVSDFGLYALLSTIWILISRLSGLGLSQSIQNFYLEPKVSPQRKKEVVTSALIGMGISSLIITVFLGCFAYFFRVPLREHNQITLSMVAALLLGAIPMQLVNFDQNLYKLEFSPWRFNLINIQISLLTIFFTLLFLFYFHWGVLGIISAPTFAFIVMTPPAIISIKKHLVAYYDWELIKKMIFFGLPFFGTELAQWIYFSMDRWILGEMTNYFEVGLYSMAFKLVMALILLIMAFSRSWGPRAMKAYAEDPHYPEFFVSFYQGWFFFLICCATVLALFGPEILRLLTPEPYWPAAQILPPLAIGLAFYGTTQAAIVFISISKQTKSLIHAAWSSVILNVIFNVIGVYYWGALGAAYALLATFFILAIQYLWIAQSVFPLPFNWSQLISYSFLALCGLYMTRYFALQPWEPWHLSVKITWLLALLILGVRKFYVFMTKRLIINEDL